MGQETMSDAGICLTCHRSLDFKWLQGADGSVAPEAPTHVVAREVDAQNRRVTWVTLQQRCRCGTVLGHLIEVAAVAAERSAPA